MQIAIISDEISYDFHTAYELGKEWNIRDFEIRCLGPDRVPDHDPVWEDVVTQYISDQRVNITAISPGLFKLQLNDPAAQSHIDERFEKSLQLAETLHCDRLILFAFKINDGGDPADPPREVIDILGAKADQAAAAGIELAIETSQQTYANNGQTTRILIDKLNHPNISTNWDPANAMNDGDTSPLQGYEAVAGTVSQVHIKDTAIPDIVVVGQGKVDWQGQLAALAKDNFKGFLTLETHIKPRLTGTRACLDTLRNLAAQYLKDT